MKSTTWFHVSPPILSKSEYVYLSLFDQSRDGIIIIDLDYMILEENKHMVNMLSYEIDLVIGM